MFKQHPRDVIFTGGLCGWATGGGLLGKRKQKKEISYKLGLFEDIASLVGYAVLSLSPIHGGKKTK
jgi:hypothetical protein